MMGLQTMTSPEGFIMSKPGVFGWGWGVLSFRLEYTHGGLPGCMCITVKVHTKYANKY